MLTDYSERTREYDEIADEKFTIEDILAAVQKANPTANLALINSAYELAHKAHEGQKRVSGEDYINHPLNVAKILADMHLDEATISAALLHDVVEDTTYTIEEMQEKFGNEVAMLIDGVTKLGKLQYKSKEEQQLENYRKLFLAMGKDIRVILIKLADRLHNMRTLKYMREDKQKRIATETLEIYAPLANRLGISNIKCELEDLCLRYIDPETYFSLAESVKQRRQERQKFIQDAINQLTEKLKETPNIHAEIRGRAKHFYSIFKKMKRDNKKVSEIYDLSAVRVLVNTLPECYSVLGMIHAMWKPIPGRFKDYIAMPKSNGYQSLHTTVMTKGYPLEIQIRTFAMHRISEYGVAAHWKYKEAGKSVNANESVYDQKLSWLRQMVNLQQEVSNPQEYLEALKMDIFSDEVFVFTPRGDIVSLPKGSVPIDFAYRIHTEVGHHCVGAKVNDKLVPLEYKLQNGDIVSIITNKSNNGPSRDWLNIVSSSETRNKIRSWFKKASREENILRGRDLLEKEIKKYGYQNKDLLKENRLALVAKNLNASSEDDLLASLGYGGMTVHGVFVKLLEMHKKEIQQSTPENVSELLSELKPSSGTSSKSSHGVLVEGEAGLLVRLARCCSPIPGDSIVGYVTRGRGVSVHRADCPNVLHEANGVSRMIEVDWDLGLDKVYNVQLTIVCNDNTGVLTSVMAIPSEMKINISSLHTQPNRKNKTSTILMGLDVKNLRQVQELMMKLRRNKDVFSVSRSFVTT